MDSIDSTTRNNFCRLCLTAGKLRHLHDLKDHIPVLLMINFLQLVLDYKVPEIICEQCFDDATKISLFIQKCLNAQAQSILKYIKQDHDYIGESEDVEKEVIETIEDEINSEVAITAIDNGELCEFSIVDNDMGALNVDSIISVENEVLSLPNTISTVTLKPKRNNLKVCLKCGETVTTLKTHYKSSRKCQPKKFQCAECGKTFSRKEQLEVHMSSHWTPDCLPFMCHICSKRFRYENSLRRHVKVHQLGRRFVCEMCGRTYTTNVQLQDHRNLHTGLFSFPCHYCEKMFSTRYARLTHEKRHSSLTVRHRNPQRNAIINSVKTIKHLGAVSCDICNRVCSCEGKLRIHMRSHDPNRTYECKICDKEFQYRLLLNKHYRDEHDDEKKISCNVCYKRFKHQMSLTIHMRTHTGERPYKCSECPKAFYQASHLNYHKLLHTGEKSFVCRFCDKRFSVKGNLTEHERLHTGEKPYTCEDCGECFFNSKAKKRHVVKEHGPAEAIL